MTMIKKITFDTPDGVHVEAEKSSPNDPWDVAHDFGDFRFYGSKTEMLKEVKKVLKLIIETDRKAGYNY